MSGTSGNTTSTGSGGKAPELPSKPSGVRAPASSAPKKPALSAASKLAPKAPAASDSKLSARATATTAKAAPKPTLAGSKSVPSLARPTSSAPKPAPSSTKSVASASTSKPAPTVSKPAPAITTSKPAAAKPPSTTAKPTASLSRPGPTTAKPAPRSLATKPSTAPGPSTTVAPELPSKPTTRPATSSTASSTKTISRSLSRPSVAIKPPATNAPASRLVPSSTRKPVGLVRSASSPAGSRLAPGSATPARPSASPVRPSTSSSAAAPARPRQPSTASANTPTRPRAPSVGTSSSPGARATTAPSILPTGEPRTISLSGGIKRAAAPAGRRRPTTATPMNAIASRQQTATNNRSGSSYIGSQGGLLSAVGGEVSLANIQLRKVEGEKPKPYLIHVKGRRKVTARVCEPSSKQLNKGDVFVLVDPASRSVYEWRGSLANKMEIAKGMDLAGRIKNKDFGGRANLVTFEEGKGDQAAFWDLIGGKTTVASADSVLTDEESDAKSFGDTIQGLVAKQGQFGLNTVATSKFTKSMLSSDHAFIVDCMTELYLWVGRGCPEPERKAAGQKVQDLLSRKGRPKWVPISRVIEGAEPEVFKEKFVDFPSSLPIGMAAIGKGRVADAKPLEKFDVSLMHTPAVAQHRQIDDGSGVVEVWRVKDHAKDAVPPEMYGQFFDGESYVILYTYKLKNKEQFIIYFWQGKKSSINEKGSSALLTVDLDDSIGGNAIHIRVVQNKEPKHFMQLFKSHIIVHKGTHLQAGEKLTGARLYQVRSCNVTEEARDIRAVQLAENKAAYLNTNDIFILNTESTQYIWLGANSKHVHNLSEAALTAVGDTIKDDRKQVFVEEKNEPEEFWAVLQGKGVNASVPWKACPRLYHASAASGSFVIQELLEWDQEDLDLGHMNIFDTSRGVYLWIGTSAPVEERKVCLDSVMEFVKTHPSSKEIKTDAQIVHAHLEPKEFTHHFLGWDNRKSKLNGEAPRLQLVSEVLKELSRTYSVEELRNPPKMLDATRLETYLTDQDFVATFGISKEIFAAQPTWKQEQQKKEQGLY